jgi:hypothetical protein
MVEGRDLRHRGLQDDEDPSLDESLTGDLSPRET